MDNYTKKELDIYNFSKASLGKHLTLDPNVPAYFGCAEALSAVLKGSGFRLPSNGIAGTQELENWVIGSKLFESIAKPETGCLVFSSSEGIKHGHCAVAGMANAYGSGIRGFMSNNSDSGLWLELWREDMWRKYYVGTLGLKLTFYRALDFHC